MGPVNHVAGVEADLGIGMGCCIVEEASAGFEGCLGSFGLGRGDGAESDQHGVVDGPCIIKEDSNDLLDQLEVGRESGAELSGGLVSWVAFP